MSIFDIFSRHPRGDISAQADGELAPERRQTLEAHLAGCERCRTELDDLLSLRSALSSLPQVAAPRSFALTPAMAEREPRPIASRATPSFVAMRVAGAGFAAVLAVVVMLDAGGIVDDTGGSSSDESSAALLDDEADGARSELDFYAPLQGSGGEIPGSLATTAPVGDNSVVPATGGGVDSGGGEPLNQLEDVRDLPDADDPPHTGSDSAGQELPDATTTAGDIQGSLNSDDLGDIAGDAEKAAAPESGDGTPATLAAEDDGTSSLLLVEIGLATIAVLAIGGSFLIRRRAESE